MSLTAAQKQKLRTAFGKRSRAELRALFALIRANDDRALIAALLPTKQKVKRDADPLVREVEQTLKPILGPVSEKAELLVEHLAKKHRRKLVFEAKGLAGAIRQLHAAKLTDAQISDGAKSLMVHLAKLHGRETVV